MERVTVGRVHKSVYGRINVRIDRQTPLGNPFFAKDESMRDEVCDKYAVWFKEQVMQQGSVVNVEFTRILELLRQGNYINLQCWCAPKRCHGDTIKAWLEYNM